ncbi:hypothetical protein GCM10025873_26970 [Demequina sediminis]|nr:hypothetical protein GCM10025873_26970 [Demequina sediminis]
MRRRVGGARHHAVREPLLDHHRAEVTDVLDPVARRLQGRALVLAHLVVRGREALDVFGIRGVDDACGVELEAQFRGTRADRLLVAQDGEVHDVAGEEGRCRAQDAVVAALGEDDVLLAAAGTVEQSVLEHQRSNDLGASDVEHAAQLVGVDALLEHRERGVDLELAFA